MTQPIAEFCWPGHSLAVCDVFGCLFARRAQPRGKTTHGAISMPNDKVLRVVLRCLALARQKVTSILRFGPSNSTWVPASAASKTCTSSSAVYLQQLGKRASSLHLSKLVVLSNDPTLFVSCTSTSSASCHQVPFAATLPIARSGPACCKVAWQTASTSKGGRLCPCRAPSAPVAAAVNSL